MCFHAVKNGVVFFYGLKKCYFSSPWKSLVGALKVLKNPWIFFFVVAMNPELAFALSFNPSTFCPKHYRPRNLRLLLVAFTRTLSGTFHMGAVSPSCMTFWWSKFAQSPHKNYFMELFILARKVQMACILHRCLQVHLSSFVSRSWPRLFCSENFKQNHKYPHRWKRTASWSQ